MSYGTTNPDDQYRRSAISVDKILKGAYPSGTAAGRTDRVHRMDAGWSLEAFEVCGTERRQSAERSCKGGLSRTCYH
jgi:hypothetical protein